MIHTFWEEVGVERAQKYQRDMLGRAVHALCNLSVERPALVPPALMQAVGGRVRMMSAAALEQPEQLTCVPEWLEARVQSALVEAYGDEYANTDPLITTATKPEFGDYQCNVAMGLGKKLKMKPGRRHG